MTAKGLEYWEYRRACFLAGQPWPGPRTRAPDAPIPVPAIPEAYTVPPAPEPVASVPYTPSPSSSIGRLEALLGAFGAEESDIAWNGGVGGVARNLSGGKRLAKGLRLGLVVSLLSVDGRVSVVAHSTPFYQLPYHFHPIVVSRP